MDDDFDVFMTYDNYCRFIEACDLYLDRTKFHLQREYRRMASFLQQAPDDNTTFIEEDTRTQDAQGFYIDIMCLNNVSDNQYIVFSIFV